MNHHVQYSLVLFVLANVVTTFEKCYYKKCKGSTGTIRCDQQYNWCTEDIWGNPSCKATTFGGSFEMCDDAGSCRYNYDDEPYCETTIYSDGLSLLYIVLIVIAVALFSIIACCCVCCYCLGKCCFKNRSRNRGAVLRVNQPPPQTQAHPMTQPPAHYPPPPGVYPPPQGGYPPAQGSYPPAQGSYPPAQSSYPPAQGSYPPAQSGYPPTQGSYPPTQGSYPPTQGGYPPTQGGYPPAQGGYPPNQDAPPSYSAVQMATPAENPHFKS